MNIVNQDGTSYSSSASFLFRAPPQEGISAWKSPSRKTFQALKRKEADSSSASFLFRALHRKVFLPEKAHAEKSSRPWIRKEVSKNCFLYFSLTTALRCIFLWINNSIPERCVWLKITNICEHLSSMMYGCPQLFFLSVFLSEILGSVGGIDGFGLQM